MSGVLKDPNSDASAPDLFYSIGPSENLQIAMRAEQSRLWIVGARKSNALPESLETVSADGTLQPTTWQSLPEQYLVADQSFSVEPIQSNVWFSSNSNPTVAILLPKAQWLAKLCEASATAPRSLAEDWECQLQQLKMSSSSNRESETSANKIMTKQVAKFAITDTALLIDLERLVESALRAVELHGSDGHSSANEPGFRPHVLNSPVELQGKVATRLTIDQLLVDSGISVGTRIQEKVSTQFAETLQISKKDSRADLKPRSMATTRKPSKPIWWQNRSLVFGSAAGATVFFITGGLLLLQSPPTKSVADAIESTKSTPTSSEQNAAPIGIDTETEPTDLDLTGALPTGNASAEAMPLPSTSAAASITSLSQDASNDLPEINLESLLTPEPDQNHQQTPKLSLNLA